MELGWLVTPYWGLVHVVGLILSSALAGWVTGARRGFRDGQAAKRAELVVGMAYLLETGQIVVLTKIEHNGDEVIMDTRRAH